MLFEELIRIEATNAGSTECCGLVIRDPSGHLSISPQKNLHTNPGEFFEMDPVPLLIAEKQGTLVAYYHSHPRGPSEISEGDRVNSEALQVPLYLYSVPTDELICYTPNGYKAPLEDRPFVPLIHDCYSLVRDYYLEKYQIELPTIFRTSRNRRQGFSRLREIYDATGAFSVDSPKEGDVILIQVNSRNYPNHAAVYVGEGRIFHHLDGKPSGYALYDGYWKRNTFRILRHPKLL